MIGFVWAWNWTLAQEVPKTEATTITIAKNLDWSITFDTSGVIQTLDAVGITKSTDLTLWEMSFQSVMFIETEEISSIGPNGESITTIRAFGIPEDMKEVFENMTSEEKDKYIENHSLKVAKMSMSTTPIYFVGDSSFTFEFTDEDMLDLKDAVKIGIEK